MDLPHVQLEAPVLGETDPVPIRQRREHALLRHAKEVAQVLLQRVLGRASEVADVVAFLCSPRSRAINGDAIAVGGGAPCSIHY
ncbi:SDR family oxidoreductase [Azohydromonas australica]|uniref:SDR family oxidoreductase n=1 Tax=Azohydromonas australica TaxID=364039 RepID=UPI001EE3B9F6|nr:SDR family oxidoreductase [Azohydromonas australica]